MDRRDFIKIGAAITAGSVLLADSALAWTVAGGSKLGWNRSDTRFSARRLYFTWSQRGNMVAQARAEIARGMYPLLSLKPPVAAPSGWQRVASGEFDGAIRTATANLPACDFCFHHEPEDDAPANGTDFRRAFDRVASLLPATARPVVCLMDWTFDPRSGRRPSDWLPARARMIALDPYNWFGFRAGATWTTPTTLIKPVVEYLARTDEQRPLAVWETNTAEDPAVPTRKADWIREFAGLTARLKLEQLVFFDWIDASGFHLLTSTQASAAVAEIMARPYFSRTA